MSIISIIGFVALGMNIAHMLVKKNYQAAGAWFAAVLFDMASIIK